MRKYCMSIMLSISIAAHAGVGGDLEKAFNNLGGLTNTSGPSSYKGQSAGMYNGGSLYMRAPVHNTQIASVDLPSFTSGCSGIDLHMGGFSFITKNQAKVLAKSIMADAQSYAFNLALETVSPMIATNYKDLRTLVNRINNSNINSCETGVGLVGSIFPKTQAAQKAVCQDIGSGSGGIFDDYASARMGCGNGGRLTEGLDKGKGNPAYKKTLLKSMNFAWKAIKGNAFIGADDELSELFMSITGTLIVEHTGGDDGPNNEKILPTLINEEDLLTTLLHGGKADIYKCDKYGEDECLNPTRNNKLTISKEKSLIYITEKTIRGIVAKLRDDSSTGLTEKEKGFIQATRLPILKMMTVQTAFSKDGGILDVASYSEIIATDILFKYLEESIDIVNREYQSLQIPQDKKQVFQDSIMLARQKLQNLKQSNYQYQTITIQLVEQTMMIEKRLASQLEGPLLDANNWAQTL